MATKVFQNDDLLRHIYGFGDPTHREQMNMNFYEMKAYTLSKVPEQYPYSVPDHHVMNDENMRESLTRFFRLRRCMCCTRHTHNKPQLYLVKQETNSWIVIDRKIYYVPECKDLHDCECDCRHDMRQLARRISYRSALNTLLYN
jgi:hypothetical protein